MVIFQGKEMKAIAKRMWRWILNVIRKTFVAGLIVVVPIGLTVWILIWIFDGIDNLFKPIVAWIFGQFGLEPITGVGFAITIVLIFIIGLITTNVVGHRFVRLGETLLGKIPVARHLYVAFREVFRGFSEENASSFLAVVLVEFPARGMHTIGFITKEDLDKDGKPVFSVFIPTTPNPTSGFLEILHEEDMIRTKISIEDALKMVISGGRMSPTGLGTNISSKEIGEQVELRKY
jgi:uncharacterized membrane protein